MMSLDATKYALTLQGMKGDDAETFRRLVSLTLDTYLSLNPSRENVESKIALFASVIGQERVYRKLNAAIGLRCETIFAN